jgi:hypothetical protein
LPDRFAKGNTAIDGFPATGVCSGAGQSSTTTTTTIAAADTASAALRQLRGTARALAFVTRAAPTAVVTGPETSL